MQAEMSVHRNVGGMVPFTGHAVAHSPTPDRGTNVDDFADITVAGSLWKLLCGISHSQKEGAFSARANKGRARTDEKLVCVDGGDITLFHDHDGTIAEDNLIIHDLMVHGRFGC